MFFKKLNLIKFVKVQNNIGFMVVLSVKDVLFL